MKFGWDWMFGWGWMFWGGRIGIFYAYYILVINGAINGIGY